MSYRSFDLAKIRKPLATLATVATLPAENPQTVANVATVAGVDRCFIARTVASVATVASPNLENEPQPNEAEVATAEWEERAAVLEYDEGLTRDDAERLATEQLTGAGTFSPIRTSDWSEVAAVDSHPRNRCGTGVCGPENGRKAQDDSHPLQPADWLPEPGPGIRILRPAVEVSADEYDAHLDTLIAALPAGSAERNRLTFAKRKGWCVERDGTRIFTRGRF